MSIVKTQANSNTVIGWVLPNNISKSPKTLNYILSPEINCTNDKIQVRVIDNCLKQEKTTCNHGKILNLYIVSKLELCQFSQANDFAITNCLFGAVKLNKNVDSDKYSYSGYGIGFDSGLTFSLSDGGKFGKNLLIFGVNNSLLAHFDNKKRVS